MRHKRMITLFVPPILIKICKRLRRYSIRHQVVPIATISTIRKDSEVLIVVGNGPSLNESMRKYKTKMSACDCIAVNHFCETTYFQELRPNHYLLADPAYFGDITTYAEWLQLKINKFIESLVSNTKWEMNLVLPSKAQGSYFLERMKDNSNIHPVFFNDKEVSTDGSIGKFELWDMNLVPPPAQTCLNTCIWLGIYLRYKRIYLIGADTTWIELLHVDQETNEVYTIDSHFYGHTRRPLYADVEGKTPIKLHHELENISRALSYYWDLREYAEYAGVEVFNASEYSLIDAYERRKL